MMSRKVRLQPGMQALYLPGLLQLCPDAWIEKLAQILLWPVRYALIIHLVSGDRENLSSKENSHSSQITAIEAP